MKVKWKVKHVVFMIVGCILLVPLVHFVIQPQVSYVLVQKQLKDSDPGGKAKVLNLLEGHIFPSQRWSLIENHFIEYGLANQFDIFTGPSFTIYNEFEPNVSMSWEEKLPYIQDYVERGPTNGFITEAATQLANYYSSNNELQKADELLLSTMERFSKEDTWARNEIMLERAKIAIKHANFNKAHTMLNELSEQISEDDFYNYAELLQLKAEVSISEGNIEEAIQHIKRGLNIFEVGWNDTMDEESTLAKEQPIFEKLQSLENRLTTMIGNNKSVSGTVKGKVVRSDGLPVKNIGVFLREGNEASRSISDFERFEAITNEQGEFEFNHVIPGSYQIYLGLMYEQIDGWSWPIDMDDWIDVESSTITYDITFHPLINIEAPANQQTVTSEHISFRWDEVKNAAYYKLNLGLETESGSMSTEFERHIDTNEITVPIEDIYAKTVGVAFSDNNDPLHSIDPNTILGFTNTENRFFWSVKAYKENGELITQSEGYRLDENAIGNLPFFYLPERKLTQADKLLLDQQVDKAINAYKTAYKNNSNDIHSLRMITRLVRMEASSTGTKEEELALPYYLELAKKGEATSEDLYTITAYYYDLNDWNSFIEWFERYKDSIGGAAKLDVYDQSIYASALMKQRKLTEARELFSEVIAKDKSHRFIGYWLAVEIMLGESFEHVIDIANNYPERPLGDEFNNWVTLLQDLQIEATQFEAYEEELQAVLQMFCKNQVEEIEAWMKTTKKLSMKRFVEALQTV